MAKEVKGMCCQGYGWKGFGMLLVGLLILWNAYMPFATWDKFIGGVLVVLGVFNLFKKNK